MDIEKIADKLEPLMPKDVAHWLRIRYTADAELKVLIEKQIISVAYQRLGDFRKKILLSLPPRNISRGGNSSWYYSLRKSKMASRNFRR